MIINRKPGAARLWVLSAVCAVFVASAVPAAGLQASGDGEGRPMKTPPKVAVEACEGKNEGEACSFSHNNQTLNGECLSGRENIFACRPHRKEQSAQGAPTETVQRPPQHDTSGPEEAVRQPAAVVPAGGVLPGKQAVPRTPPAAAPAPTRPTDLSAPAVLQPVEKAAPPSAGMQADYLKEYGLAAGVCLVVALMSILLTWYGFFRNVTQPLRRLRMVTRQLADGNLSARVGEGLVQRRDEVADLARDVDRMAGRIESLVGAHQRLIRDVSHELRSPLARLNVALELARQSAGPAHSAPFDRIERESERLNDLIGQLLMLTRLESESGMGERGDVDLVELIGEIAQDVDFEARSNQKGVVTAIVGKEMRLNGNRELLRQALENLVRNAVRYTGIDTEVEVSLRGCESGGRRWGVIEVRDHGPGVPESELVNIFRPFYRVGDSRERQSGGAGVGLAISDRAVQLHGGTLKATNAPEGGLVMEMELPLP